jgi:hypothetical protein
MAESDPLTKTDASLCIPVIAGMNCSKNFIDEAATSEASRFGSLGTRERASIINALAVAGTDFKVSARTRSLESRKYVNRMSTMAVDHGRPMYLQKKPMHEAR